MATLRATLSRQGTALGPLELVRLQNGTVLPAGVYQALSEAYVEMMRQRGVLTPGGEINPSALRDAASIERTRASAEREAAAVRSPDSRPAPRARASTAPARVAFRPTVPVREILSFEGRYCRAFGDSDWIQVDLDARSFASGSGSGGHLGAELDVVVTLPGLGRKLALKEELDVAVLWDICSTRTAVEPVGSAPRVATHPHELRSVGPWQSRQSLGRMQVDALGVPVDLWVDMVGAAGVASQGSARSAHDDVRAARGIMETALASAPTALGDDTVEGAYAKLALEGCGQVDLSLSAAVSMLSRYHPGLPVRIAGVLAQIPALDPWECGVAVAGASLSVDLADLQLRADGTYGLDFFHAEERGGVTLLTDHYVHSGTMDARLSARLLTDPSIQVFFGLSAPEGVDVTWGFAPLDASWSRLGARYEVWGWEGPLFEREISVLEKQWSVDLGPGSHPMFERRLPAANGV